MAEGPPCTLAVENFCSDKDDFEAWVNLFEAAIRLGYPSANLETFEGHCKIWLPLKLDDEARTISGNIDPCKLDGDKN